MMIEIHGGGFVNKGAELMLLTVLQEFRRFANVCCCVEPGRFHPYFDRMAWRLYQLFPMVKFSFSHRVYVPAFRTSCFLGKVIPGRILEGGARVRRQDTDALVDISGYAFGDPCGVDVAKNFATRAAHYRRRGKPVILLPQTFGPFDKPNQVESFVKIMENANLIYARDRISLEYAQSCCDFAECLKIAPDITIFFEPDMNHKGRKLDVSYACLVPNARMLNQGQHKEVWRKVYVTRLADVARRLVSEHLRVVILVHEFSGGDEALAREVVEQVRVPHCDVRFALDALEAKSLIAGSRLVVGSRYHSIVGALSSGVPAIALGWSHKYEELMNDFEVSGLIHGATDPPEHLTSLTDDLMDDTKWSKTHELLLKAKQGMTEANREMWRDSLAILGLGKTV